MTDGTLMLRPARDADRAVADICPTAGVIHLLREQLLAVRAHSFTFTAERPRGVERLLGLWRAPVPA